MVILKVIRTVISYVDLNTGNIKAVCALPEPRGFYKYIYSFKRHRERNRSSYCPASATRGSIDSRNSLLMPTDARLCIEEEVGKLLIFSVFQSGLPGNVNDPFGGIFTVYCTGEKLLHIY